MRQLCSNRKFSEACREFGSCSDYHMNARKAVRKKGATEMKYILLMSGTKAGVDGYRAWSKKDIDGHMAVLVSLNRELTESGEFVATQGLTAPHEAKLVCGMDSGTPVTDGIFPESKEFLLGYWIVDVATPERAYEIAGRISAAPGPGGIPTNVPIEVRQFAVRSTQS